MEILITIFNRLPDLFNLQYASFPGPHISRMCKKWFRFCPKFLDLYASIYGKSIRTQRIDESEAKTPPVHVRQRRLELHSGIVIEKLFQFNLN